MQKQPRTFMNIEKIGIAWRHFCLQLITSACNICSCLLISFLKFIIAFNQSSEEWRFQRA
ncbi:hypothetical protein D3C73_917150 [compost metagenome]